MISRNQGCLFLRLNFGLCVFLRLTEKGGFRFRSLMIGSRSITDQEVHETVSSGKRFVAVFVVYQRTQFSGNWDLRFFASFGKEFPNFALVIIRVDSVEILA
ncbi:hypothetical protein GQ457_12G012810 [Hibiscus cannabinus]